MSGTKRDARVIANHADAAWRKLLGLRRDLLALAELIDADNGEGQDCRDVAAALRLLSPTIAHKATAWDGYARARQ